MKKWLLHWSTSCNRDHLHTMELLLCHQLSCGLRFKVVLNWYCLGGSHMITKLSPQVNWTQSVCPGKITWGLQKSLYLKFNDKESVQYKANFFSSVTSFSILFWCQKHFFWSSPVPVTSTCDSLPVMYESRCSLAALQLKLCRNLFQLGRSCILNPWNFQFSCNLNWITQPRWFYTLNLTRITRTHTQHWPVCSALWESEGSKGPAGLVFWILAAAALVRSEEPFELGQTLSASYDVSAVAM